MMAALYFTWTGWTQGPPERYTFSLRDTFFMHAPFTHGDPENICQLHQHGGPIVKIESWLGIIHADVCGTPPVRPVECRVVQVWMCSICLTKGRVPLLRHQVSRTKARSSEQQSSKKRSPSNVTGEIKGDFYHLCKVPLVSYNTPTHTHPHYNLFTSWKYMGSHTGGGVWSSNLCS